MLNFITEREHVVTGDYSVTELLQPPRIYQLKKRHGNELHVDVMDSLMSMLGTAFHDLMEQHTKTGEAELLLAADFNGVTISGTIDWLHDNTITDYKTTSVWSYIFDKPEWEQQLNLYRWLAKQNGFAITNLEVAAIFRDWSESRTNRDDYPQYRGMRIPQDLWLTDQIEQFLSDRISAHVYAEHVSDDDLRYCTAEERWVRGNKWAVYKSTKSRRASKLFPPEEEFEARHYADKFDNPVVKYRPGKSIRCDRYCPASIVCNQWLEIQKIELREELEERPLGIG